MFRERLESEGSETHIAFSRPVDNHGGTGFEDSPRPVREHAGVVFDLGRSDQSHLYVLSANQCGRYTAGLEKPETAVEYIKSETMLIHHGAGGVVYPKPAGQQTRNGGLAQVVRAIYAAAEYQIDITPPMCR